MAKVTRSEKKEMLMVFSGCKGIIYQHYVSKGCSINSKHYVEVLTAFLHHLKIKRPEKIANGWLFHQDNARQHVSKYTMEFMAKKGISMFDHAPYSPDLAPCDFYLFSELKKHLPGTRFSTKQELQTSVQGYLRSMSKEGFLHVMEVWSKRMDKCIVVKGDYIEK